MMCTAEIYPSFHSSPLVASDEEERQIGSKFNDYGNLSDSSAILHEDRKWRSFSEEDSSFCMDFSPLSRLSVIMRREKFSPAAFPPKSTTQTDREIKINILCELPVEVATIVLGFLHPEDLCRVCMVCRSWYNLAQEKSLRQRRKHYLKARQHSYNLSRENSRGHSVTPSHRHINRRDMTTPVLSPLNQSLDVETSSLFSHLHYVSPPVVPRAHTPGMALVERVGKLSIEGSDIRRCLFPLTSTELKRNTGHLTCPADSITLGVHDTRICRKSNKCRLRRL